MTGGNGYHDLHRFYQDYFIPGNPPSLKMKLISRTIGTDRVVDEMFMSFRHTQEVPWILPGVAPTDRLVEVALVAIVCIRGGKLYREHIYWDSRQPKRITLAQACEQLQGRFRQLHHMLQISDAVQISIMGRLQHYREPRPGIVSDLLTYDCILLPQLQVVSVAV